MLNTITRETLQITKEEFDSESIKYQHVTKNLTWYNNGVSNIRMKPFETIPNGFIKGRIKSQLNGHRKKIITCPNCGLSGGSSNMKRYHFDNCKSLHRLKL